MQTCWLLGVLLTNRLWGDLQTNPYAPNAYLLLTTHTHTCTQSAYNIRMERQGTDASSSTAEQPLAASAMRQGVATPTAPVWAHAQQAPARSHHSMTCATPSKLPQAQLHRPPSLMRGTDVPAGRGPVPLPSNEMLSVSYSRNDASSSPMSRQIQLGGTPHGQAGGVQYRTGTHPQAGRALCAASALAAHPSMCTVLELTHGAGLGAGVGTPALLLEHGRPVHGHVLLQNKQSMVRMWGCLERV